MSKRLSILLLSFLFVSNLFAVDRYNLFLKAGNFVPEENFKSEISNSIAVQSGYYIIQFYQIPTGTEQDLIRSTGIALYDYLPERAFYARVPASYDFSQLGSHGVRSVVPLEASFKSRPAFLGEIPDYCREGKKDVRVSVALWDDQVIPQFVSDLKKIGGSFKEEKIYNSFYEVLVPEKKRAELLAIQGLKFAEFGDGPSVPDDVQGRTLNRVNSIQNPMNGMNFDGSGVSVSLMDDGIVGPHIDLQGRIFDQSTSNGGSHGDGTVGIVMGAGNINPDNLGMAPRSTMIYYPYSLNSTGYPHVNNIETNHDTAGTILTSSSYSNYAPNAVGGQYNNYAAGLDGKIYDNPWFSSIFSAGNVSSASYSQTYPNTSSPWATISGSQKASKNSICVANLDFQDQLITSSSRGPAGDGRIKPDIAAYGSGQISLGNTPNSYQTFGGTSAACPGIAGVITTLYHAYREYNGGQDPDAGLVKAAMLNTAEDLGNPGPDYFYGWGRANALRVVRTFQNNQFLKDSVSQNGTNQHVINVPANTEEVRVMVLWMDPAGTIGSTKHLVNDLDIEMETPSASIFLPWALDHRDMASALSAPATRAIDSVNNMEQVTIPNPAAGAYTVRVKGKGVPTGPQVYHLVYEFRTAKPEITYPMGGENFLPNTTESIRWDGSSTGGTYDLFYSLDNGGTWSSIVSNLPANRRSQNWFVPSANTDDALIRIMNSASADTMEFNFTIRARPNIGFSAVCNDSAQLSWPAIPGAFGYIIRELGAKYMDSIGYTTGTSWWVTTPLSSNSDWFTVTAIGANGEGKRAIAIRPPNTVSNCPESPIAEFSAQTKNTCVGKPVSFMDESINVTTSWQWSITPATHTYVNGTSATSQDPIVTFDAPGSYNVTLDATNSNGTGSITKNNYVTTITGDPTPLNEGFQGALPPGSWELENPNGDVTWERSTNIAGINGLSRTAFIPYFFLNSVGREDILKTHIMDLTGINNPKLVFEVANAQRVATVGPTLRIDVSTDCGDTFQPTGYEKTGPDLATVTGTFNTSWIPGSSSEWRTDTISLNAFKTDKVQVAIVGVSAVIMNNLYIDNVRIIDGGPTGLRGSVNETSVKIYPNPAADQLFIQGVDGYEFAEYSIFDITGKEMIHESISFTSSQVIDITGLSSGTYMIRIQGHEGPLVKKFQVE